MSTLQHNKITAYWNSIKLTIFEFYVQKQLLQKNLPRALRGRKKLYTNLTQFNGVYEVLDSHQIHVSPAALALSL